LGTAPSVSSIAKISQPRHAPARSLDQLLRKPVPQSSRRSFL